MNATQVVKILKSGGVGVMATDTIYGILGSAMDEGTVERIYQVRKRTPSKPLIILISSISDIKKFGIALDSKTKKMLSNFWPGKVSIILPCRSKKFEYLHRGSRSLAFRLPAKKSLVKLIKKTGPLVAPSANPEGLLPAKTIGQARKYFGQLVNFYLDSGRASGRPSKILRLIRGRLEVIRL